MERNHRTRWMLDCIAALKPPSGQIFRRSDAGLFGRKLVEDGSFINPHNKEDGDHVDDIRLALVSFDFGKPTVIVWRLRWV